MTTSAGSRDADAYRQQLAYADALLKETREEITRADAKAATLLAAGGVVTGVLLGAALAGDWSPLALTAASQIAWWISAACGAYGLVALASAVMPTTRRRRMPPGPDSPLGYYGDVAACAGPEELREGIARRAADPLGRTAEQLWLLSHVVARKYHKIRAGLFSLGMGLGGFVGSLVLQLATR